MLRWLALVFGGARYGGRPGRSTSLLIDPHDPSQHVDMRERQPEGLALEDTGARSEDRQRPVSIWEGFDKGLHLLREQRHHVAGGCFREPNSPTRRGRDQAVLHGTTEDRRHIAVDHLHRRGRENVGTIPDPRLNLARADGGDRTIAENRQHVVAQVGLDLRGRRRPVHLQDAPLPCVVAEALSPGGGVDVRATSLVHLDRRQPPLGVGLSSERP